MEIVISIAAAFIVSCCTWMLVSRWSEIAQWFSSFYNHLNAFLIPSHSQALPLLPLVSDADIGRFTLLIMQSTTRCIKTYANDVYDVAIADQGWIPEYQ